MPSNKALPVASAVGLLFGFTAFLAQPDSVRQRSRIENINRTMKKIRNLTCIIALATLFAGCVTPPHQMATPFDESALQRFAGNGTSTVTGQAFLKTQGGDVKFGAGDTVSLMPVTPYTTEAWRAARGGEQPQTDPRLQKYIRTAIADGNGNFEFQNIPAGDYYIECPIFWAVAGEYGPYQTGGVAYTQTHVDDGQTVKVVVTLQ